jgi:4-amino-4-deoxy-L-arabinose transferase-like glycosyltransferase
LNPRLAPAIRKFTLLFLGCVLFHLPATWTMPLLDRDEPRFAEASREMLERGDYVVPFLNNRYRFDKPPFIYWTQTLSYRVFGENDFAARFPSVVAAALIAVMLFAWGRRVGGERVGWWAAIIFTVCLQTFTHARAAVADMWLVLFMTLAWWAGYELLRDRLTNASAAAVEPIAIERRWWWIFYLALAFAFLAKGPVGWLPLLTVALTRFFLPAPHLNRRFLFATGIAFMLSLVAVWGIPALSRTNGDFMRIGIGKHVVARSVVAMEGHGATSLWTYLVSLPFYFGTVFITFFPWSFKLPWLVKKRWRERDAIDNYLIAGIGIVFVIFTFVKTKLPHYTMPAFPLLALLLAKALADAAESARFIRRAAIGAAALGLAFACATPILARYSPSLQLIRAARADLRPEMEFGAVDYKEPSLVWYARKYVDGFMSDLDDDLVHPFMEKPGARFVVLPTRMASELYPALPEGWKTHRVQGINPANGKRTDITMILKPS